MWKPEKITLSLAQYQMSDRREDNIEKAVHYIRLAAARGAQIVSLPELFETPYFCQEESCRIDYRIAAEKILSILMPLASELKVVIVAGSIFEISDHTTLGYNTSYVIDADGSNLGFYRKVHIPHDPGFWEANYFLPGDSGFKVFETKYAKISPLICFDQWFPEAARCCALQGAEILFYPTAIGYPINKPQPEGYHQDAWELIQRSHGIANSCIVASTNRCGVEDQCQFFGGSFISDAFGRVLAKGDTSECLVTSEVDLEHSRYIAREWLFRNKRSPKDYNAISKM